MSERRLRVERLGADRAQVGDVDVGDALADAAQQRLAGAVVVGGGAVGDPA